MAQLELFYKQSCPFCHRVMDYMREHNIKDVEMIDIIADASQRDRLIRIGGKPQVPCLFVDGKPLYESMDIINYFADTFGSSTEGIDPASMSGSCRIDGTGCN